MSYINFVSYCVGLGAGIYLGLWAVVGLLGLFDHITRNKFDAQVYFDVLNVDKRILKLEQKNGRNTNKSKK